MVRTWLGCTVSKRKCRVRFVLCELLILFFLASGCALTDGTGDLASPAQNQLHNAPLYVVDGISSDTIHRRTCVLTNDSANEKCFIFVGKSCGCLECEHDGKSLKVGEIIRVAARRAEQVDLCNRLAYLEGFYSNSASFATDDAPAQQLTFESPYAVVKQMLVSPGALVFERADVRDPFTCSVEVKFRSIADVNAQLLLTNVPPSIKWHADHKAKGTEQSLPPSTKTFFEDVWIVKFEIDPESATKAALTPDGKIQISILDDGGEMRVSQLVPYNAERVVGEHVNVGQVTAGG